MKSLQDEMSEIIGRNAPPSPPPTINSTTTSGANTPYDKIIHEVRTEHESFQKRADYYIPRLCDALKRENKNCSKDDIRDRVERDCIEFWVKATIRKCLPDWLKDESKVKAGKISANKKKEQLISVETNSTQSSSISEKEQDPNELSIQPIEAENRTVQAVSSNDRSVSEKQVPHQAVKEEQKFEEYKDKDGHKVSKKTARSRIFDWEKLIHDLTEALTGLSDTEQGRIMANTSKGTSSRHELVEKTREFRFTMIKQMSSLETRIGQVQILKQIIDDFSNQLYNELLTEKKKGELLTE